MFFASCSSRSTTPLLIRNCAHSKSESPASRVLSKSKRARFMMVRGLNLDWGRSLPVAAQFVEQIELDFLDFDHPLPLVRQQVVDFFVQLADFQLGLQVDL